MDNNTEPTTSLICDDNGFNNVSTKKEPHCYYKDGNYTITLKAHGNFFIEHPSIQTTLTVPAPNISSNKVNELDSGEQPMEPANIEAH